MRRALLMFVIMLSSNAFATEWELFDKKNGVSSYIDSDSKRIDEADSKHIAWLKSVYDKPQKLRQKAPGNEYFQKLELVYMNCSERSYLVDQTVYLDKDGNTITPKKVERDYGVVVPESTWETRHMAMCKKPFLSIRELSKRGIRYHDLEEPKPKWWNPFGK
jgi:hypothetical protein